MQYKVRYTSSTRGQNQRTIAKRTSQIVENGQDFPSNEYDANLDAIDNVKSGNEHLSDTRTNQSQIQK